MATEIQAGQEIGAFKLTGQLEGTSLWCAEKDEQRFVLKPLYWVTPQLQQSDPWWTLDAPALPKLKIPGLSSYSLESHQDREVSTWLVMPFAEGAPLSETVSGGPSTRQDALSIIRVLSRTLEALHGEGLFHNAICAENVFVLPGQGPVLVSYGQPEALDTSEERNARWDLYCLGVLLGELLTGKFGFDGKSRPETSDDGSGFHRRNRSIVQFAHFKDIEDRDLRGLVIDLTCATSSDYITNTRDLGERVDAILEGDHRLRDLKSDFGDVKEVLGAQTTELTRQFQDLKVVQQEALAIARSELEAVRQELLEEKAALVAAREAVDDRIGRIEKIGIGLAAFGGALGLVFGLLGVGPLVTNAELNEAYGFEGGAAPLWSTKVVTQAGLCDMALSLGHAGEVNALDWKCTAPEEPAP